MQKIISWNVASVRARLPALLRFLAAEKPDILMLQEIKATTDTFPFFDCQLAGYSAAISGQKGFNGVAILSQTPLTLIRTALPGFEDQARFIHARTDTGLTLISVYVPNGNPPEKDPTDTTRLTYKLNWMRTLITYMADLIRTGERIVLAGDFNVIERDSDVYNPDLFRESALMIPPVRQAYSDLCALPLTNAIRRFYPQPQTYSFWDFQGGAWPRNNGILLDAVLTTQNLEQHIKNAHIYREVRGWPGPSDHVPVGIELSDGV